MGVLTGKRALITGGTTGIGLATAKAFLAEGARVAITGQSRDRLDQAQSELGIDVLCIRADAGRVADAETLITEVGQAFDGLDVLFLNAGIAKFAPLADVTEAFFDEQFAINVKGVLFTAQKAAPLMAAGGSIVVNTSVNNRMGMAGTLVYAASKAAARSLVRVLAAEFASRGVRVNAISPGPIETPIFGKLGLPDEQLQSIAGGLIQKIPLGRFGHADEIAKAVLFLASDNASFITGVELVADGGWTEIMP
ncbi:MAG TPA: SDR family oxidoreductase [Geobacterales bacterium]|jgi:NAD(P)-dependent dehydrogenase (short-subunit alcohol dehydrogenase family)|nr:SDR family oxidoreductase [Geobacterales bacterium]